MTFKELPEDVPYLRVVQGDVIVSSDGVVGLEVARTLEQDFPDRGEVRIDEVEEFARHLAGNILKVLFKERPDAIYIDTDRSGIFVQFPFSDVMDIKEISERTFGELDP